jgi:hypothetical protein
MHAQPIASLAIDRVSSIDATTSGPPGKYRRPCIPTYRFSVNGQGCTDLAACADFRPASEARSNLPGSWMMWRRTGSRSAPAPRDRAGHRRNSHRPGSLESSARAARKRRDWILRGFRPMIHRGMVGRPRREPESFATPAYRQRQRASGRPAAVAGTFRSTTQWYVRDSHGLNG